MSQIIKDLLDKDKECRREDIEDDLYCLNDFNPNETWDYSLPTLTYTSSKKKKYINNNKEFVDKFFDRLYIFNGVDTTNLLFAGECVSSILSYDNKINNIDIFLYGLNTIDEAKLRIEKFVVDIYKNIELIKSGHYLNKYLKSLNKKLRNEEISREEYDELTSKKNLNNCTGLLQTNINDKISILFDKHSMTIYWGKEKIQVTLRIYKTLSSILHGFDIGSSSVGFDGKKLYFTSLSKFCYENNVNILDTTRRSTTYEKKIVKYMDKGFNIILPYLDISKLKCNYHKYNLIELCELPYFVFSYNKIINNCIYVDRFFNSELLEKYCDEKNNNSDYTSIDLRDDDDYVNGYIKYKIFYFNLMKINSIIKKKNKDKNFLDEENGLIYVLDFNKEAIKLKNENKLIDDWEITFKNNFIDFSYVEKLYGNKFNTILKKIDVNFIEKYINVISPQKFISEFYLNKDKKYTYRELLLKKLFKKQKKEIYNFLKTYKYDINWTTKNPTSQFTSSVNPILDNVENWYDKKFKDNFILKKNNSESEDEKNNSESEDEKNNSESESEDEKNNSESESESESEDEKNNSESEDEYKKNDNESDSEDEKNNSESESEDKKNDNESESEDEDKKNDNESESEDKKNDNESESKNKKNKYFKDEKDNEENSESTTSSGNKYNKNSSNETESSDHSIKKKDKEINNSTDKSKKNNTDTYSVKFKIGDKNFKGTIDNNSDNITFNAFDIIVKSQKFDENTLKNKGVDFYIKNNKTEEKLKYFGKKIGENRYIISIKK